MKWSEMSERERDVLIADKVFDYVYLADEGFCVDGWGEPVPLGNYNANIADAWQVVEKMKSCIFSKRRRFLFELQRVISDANDVRSPDAIAFSDIILYVSPEYLCIAALKACGVEIE